MMFIKKLFLIFCFMISFCTILNAQTISGGSDGFFKSDYSSEYNNRTPNQIDQINVTTQNFGEPASLNNSLVILCLFGLCYVLYKRRKDKVLGILLLTIIISSCNRHTINLDEQKERLVNITFNTSSSKTGITPMGQVTFSSNDKLHVFASGINNIEGRYLGSITNGNDTGSSAQFTGTVENWYEGEQISFYYIGQTTVNSTGTTIIDFSDQSYKDQVQSIQNDLDNISKHYHVSRYQVVAPDDAETTSFTGQLKNMMALAVFNTSEFSSDNSNVKIVSSSGLNNMIKIYPDGSIEYGVIGINNSPSVDNQSGHIIIGKGVNKKYVALLPTTETIPANINVSFTSNNKVSRSSLNLNIGINSFLYEENTGSTIIGYTINADNYSSENYINFMSPQECLSVTHKFTVSEEEGYNKEVVFSQGNLVYDCGRFKQHKNPWEICQINSNSDIKVTSTFDRFGWAASGYNFGQTIFQPYSNSTTQYSSSIGYGYGPLGTGSTMYKQSFHPHEKYRKQDWGWYQFGMDIYEEYSISSGNNSYWRTLGQAEWIFLFKNRSTTSTNLIDYSTNLEVTDARFAKATINNVRGVILFPDSYTHPNSNIHLSYINSNGSNGFTANNISVDDFWTLHNAGVEFLPINSYYDKTTEQISTSTSAGYYWSCKTQVVEKAIYCKINITEGVTTTTLERYQGLFVRLVFQVNGIIYK